MEITPDIGAEVDSAPVQETATQAEVTQEAPKEESSTFSADDFKKLQKQLAAQDRRIGRMTAAKYQTQRELQELREWKAAQAKAADEKKSERPSIDKFNSYDEYQEAITDWKVEQKLKGMNPEKPAEPISKVPPQDAEWYAQKTTEMTNQAQELGQHIPDFYSTFQENKQVIDIIDNNYELEKAFLQSQHPALAAYVLAKEGKLEDLLDMTPQQVAYEVGRATHVGVSNIKQYAAKQTTKAPAPMASAKGTASGAKTPDTMTGHELLKWIRSN